MTSTLPEWVKSQRNARGLCAGCGDGPCDTTWAGTGLDICWACCETRQATYQERTASRCPAP